MIKGAFFDRHVKSLGAKKNIVKSSFSSRQRPCIYLARPTATADTVHMYLGENEIGEMSGFFTPINNPCKTTVV